MEIDRKRIEAIFRVAGGGRLLEHQVYGLLEAMGIPTPRFFFIPRGEAVTKEDLTSIPSEQVVIKVVSPVIIHKSDVGGVRFAANTVDDVQRVIIEMANEIPARFEEWSETSSNKPQAEIQGFLICEAVRFEDVGFGSEILIGLRTTREFGPVLTVGLGGLDVEYLTDRLKERQAVTIASPFLVAREDLPALLEPLAFYQKLTRSYRGRDAVLSPDTLTDVCSRFLQLGAVFSSTSDSTDFVIEEFEVNPFVISGGALFPLDGVCRISRRSRNEMSRPFAGIRYLLEPQTIGIIGVSEKMNIGHIILNNILNNGFPAENITVVKPEADSIEGCRCVPTVFDLPSAVDMFVLTVSAEQSHAVMKELVDFEKARSVIIIAGGIGEKEGTENLEKQIQDLLAGGRRDGKLTPVVNGGNCLGLYSRPGRYDTTFVPQHKLYQLPRKGTRKEKLAIISQSGAYMISRMSRIPFIDPVYAVSIGNQIDLTLSDYLNYLKESDDIEVFAVYAEGFPPGDGLAFARAVKDIVSRGKTVLVYKSGRSAEGRAATASHTASVAGDYRVSRSLLEQAGAIVAEDIFEFETTLKNLLFLSGKTVGGNRIGLISNAGFECVIMSDNLKNDHNLELARFSEETNNRLRLIMQPLGIDRLQDIHNPLDITPVASDEVFCLAAEAILDDPQVDCAVISPLPMSPAMNTLAPSSHHREDLNRPGSTAQRLVELFKKTKKPFVVSVDSGEIYRPFSELLESNGVPTFSHCDWAVRFLRKYVNRP
ncbi:MAG: acetate--CoA ligase family protein [Acidobacteria bacterium]|nr:acetate--CoA ligase family protein [Acidobacteriota bacterium]